MMKSLLIALTVLTLASSSGHAQLQASAQSKPFALVELFTSEGCSSCPSAEKHLDALIEQGQARVFPIAYHVDYWDYLGWKDQFASRQFTDRQRDYAHALNLRSLYTPQMIVNGTQAFVGSDRAKGRKAIDRALETHSPQSFIQLDAKWWTAPEQISVRFSTRYAPKHAVLHVLLLESHLKSKALAGENAGRSYVHHNVVRQMKSIAIARREQGQVNFPLKNPAQKSHYKVLAFVQNPETMAILAAEWQTL